MALEQPDLQVTIGTLRLKNPVLTASGTFGYGKEFAALVNLQRLGGIIAKGISLTPVPAIHRREPLRHPAAC
jgi:dihydroorotate dehydrogenase (NAD+) catalytic subunit